MFNLKHSSRPKRTRTLRALSAASAQPALPAALSVAPSIASSASPVFIFAALAITLFAGMLTATGARAQDYPSVEFGGRIQADATTYSGDAEKVRDKDGDPVYVDDSEVRRFRLYLRGNLSEHWQYRLQYDFAGIDSGSNDKPDLKDGYIRYTGFENQAITVGNFKVFSGLEELISSNNNLFAERSVVNALDEGRRLAIGYANWSEHHSLGLAYYGHEPNNDKQGSGYSGRFVYRPRFATGGDESQLLHLGINLSQQQPDTERSANPERGDTFRVRARAGNHQDAARIVNTGHIYDVDSYAKLGLELAYQNKRFAFQSEWARQSFNLGDMSQSTYSDPEFNGYYAQVSYFLTDDTRPYSNSSGTFGTVSPSAENGAWQVAARVGNLDLTDGGVMGGEVDTLSLALNYYQTRALRFTLNYVAADADEVAQAANGFQQYQDPSSWILRLRYTF